MTSWRKICSFACRDMGIRLRLGESVSKIEIIGDQVEATMASNKKLASQR